MKNMDFEDDDCNGCGGERHLQHNHSITFIMGLAGKTQRSHAHMVNSVPCSALWHSIIRSHGTQLCAETSAAAFLNNKVA